jgi:hypothetical protein
MKPKNPFIILFFKDITLMLKILHLRFPIIYDICYENYKGLTKNPRWLLMRKLARFHLVRSVIRYLANLTNKPSEFSLRESQTLFPDINSDLVIDNLKKDAFCFGINLPGEIVEEIVSFAYSNPCYIHRKPKLGFYYHQKKLAESSYGNKLTLAGYFNTSVLCPAINKLQNDPILLAIAAKYLEQEPVHIANLLWWSFTSDGITSQEKKRTFQMFHYDVDDYRFLKFFFYLTDVDLYSGPHVCIRGSHRKKKLSHLLLPKSKTDDEILNYYGSESLVTICGKAGFGFAEDTFCFHKGETPIIRDRLMLQIEFGTTDYGMQHDLREPSLLQLMSSNK